MTTKGFYGDFWWLICPGKIQVLLDELEVTFDKYREDEDFLDEYRYYLRDYSGREPSIFCREPDSTFGWSEDLPQKGRLKSFGLA